ncbi:IS110 family transposase [bacterium]|nr:IS110 family transposase [bacterium]
MKEDISHVGLDVHKQFIQVALLLPDRDEPLEWRVANEPTKVSGMIRKIGRLTPGPVQLCYEAGPCGYELSRKLNAVVGFSCQVIAPSLIPRKPGDRIKTDRRDAKKLALYLRAGLLTEVRPPSSEDEARRELSRARGAAKKDETAAKHRVLKFMLRHDRIYRGGKSNWTQMHYAWLRQQRFDNPLLQLTCDEYLWALEHVQERVKKLEAALEEAAQDDAVREAVELLGCFKGIGAVSAMTIVSELYSFERFDSPMGLMAFLGMTPSEYSSSGDPKRGGITKAGNGRLRRVMVEAAQNCVRSPRAGVKLTRRRADQPAWAVALADKAQLRLYRRFHHLTFKGKTHNKAIMAVAREFVGFIWAMLTQHRFNQLEVGT